MIKRVLKIVCAATAVIMVMLSLTSCFYNARKNTGETTAGPTPPEKALPADVAGKIDLKAKDPSNDSIKFSYDAEGRVASCEYSRGEAKYFAGYTYSDGEVDVSLFANDADGNVFTLDAARYKTSAPFDAEAGFIEKDGYYFNGYGSLELIKPETTAADKDTTASPESESAAVNP